MKIVTSKVIFNGLYYWGSGWANSELARKWDEFWDSKDANGIFWTSFKKEEGFGTVRYLVSTGSSIYLHPMNAEIVIRKIGKTTRIENGVEVEHCSEIEELEEIFKKCCDYVGGSFEIAPIKIHEINS